MKKIDFTQEGGFPLTQDSLNFMQDTYLENIKAALAIHDVPQAGKFAISGIQPLGESVGYTSGWVVFNGEIIQVAGGAGLYLRVIETIEEVQFEDFDTHGVYKTKHGSIVAVPGDDTYLATDFIRIDRHVNVQEDDANYLGGRTFQYSLLPHTRSITIDGTDNTKNGFCINRINPFAGIRNGHQLLVRMKQAGCLTNIIKAGVGCNIAFKSDDLVTIDDIQYPNSNKLRFGADNYFGSSAGGLGAAIYYGTNPYVMLVWSSESKRWIETHRGQTLEGY